MNHTSNLPPDHLERLARARLSLDGLSVGDAYGQNFFHPTARRSLHQDEPAHLPGTWLYTDDTVMALGILEVLEQCGRVDQEQLARVFGRRFLAEPNRGYGAGAVRLLFALAMGNDWRLESRGLFSGMGSFGNGSAMRVAPLGAYFADDLGRAAAEARLSAEVTHWHAEGKAGAMALAVAAAFVWSHRLEVEQPRFRAEFFNAILAHTPPCETRKGIEHAVTLPADLSTIAAATLLGNGDRISCMDTVPFCLWSIATHIRDYPHAIWQTCRVLGDIDTNVAIVGGVVALATGREGIPTAWLAQRETLPG